MQNSKANDTSQSKSRQSISSHPVSGEAGEFHSNQAAPASSALSLEDAEEILRRVTSPQASRPPKTVRKSSAAAANIHAHSRAGIQSPKAKF